MSIDSAAPLVRIPRDGDLPLSLQQEVQLARHWQRHGRTLGIPPGALRLMLSLRGRLNAAALEFALEAIVRRHEILRTTYAMRPRQWEAGDERFVIGTDPAASSWFGRDRVDLRIHETAAVDLRVRRVQADRADREAVSIELARIAAADEQEGFRPDQVPMVRCTLVQVDAAEHLLLVTLPNVISDYWSRSVIRSEIETWYDVFVAGSVARPPELRFQYVDFAAWQRRRFSGDTLAAVRRFWTAQWQEFHAARIPYGDLPFALAPNPDAARTVDNAFVRIEHADAVRIRRSARLNGSTMYLLGLTAFHILMHGYTGRNRLATLCGVGDRSKPGTEALIGLFTNAQLLGVRVSPDDSAQTCLDHVRDAFVSSEAHAAPAAILRSAIPDTSVISTATDMAFDFFDNRQQTSRTLSDGVVVDYASVVEPSTGRACLNFLLVEFGHELRVRAQYRTDAFRAADIQRVLEEYKTILTAIVEHPDTRIASLVASHVSGAAVERRA